jgi:hypothetical protein
MQLGVHNRPVESAVVMICSCLQVAQLSLYYKMTAAFLHRDAEAVDVFIVFKLSPK